MLEVGCGGGDGRFTSEWGLGILFPCHLGNILLIVNGCVLLGSILMVMLITSRLGWLQMAIPRLMVLTMMIHSLLWPRSLMFES